MGRLCRCFMLAACVSMVACGDSGPQTGVLIVGNSTFGANLDADGYVVTINGGDAKRIALNVGDEWTLAVGVHSVALADIQANCATDEANGASTGPNPQQATISAGSRISAWFAVVCN